MSRMWTSVLAMAPNPENGQAQGSGVAMFVYLALFLALMYFMLIRPQKRREKERQALLASVKTGDRVLFAGGFLGTVSNVKEKTLTVKIAEGVKVEIARGAVAQVLEKGESPELAERN
ncbi:MAG: preprotein translocase subunit YajC [Kiritimatiellae bacterium]|nr:preprotein translocase subunit YajC [Kiritimatiellia bacterium]